MQNILFKFNYEFLYNRLLRAVFNDGHPAAQHRREQNVHRRADGDDVEIDVPTNTVMRSPPRGIMNLAVT